MSGQGVKKSGSEDRIKEANFLDALSEITIHGKAVSVSIGNPKLEDNPLIGVSEGFELLTGYKRNEIIGRNCRFLNDGCTVTRDQRSRMHASVYEGAECIEILDNAKKSGEPFKNLLHMRTLDLGGRKYIIGIQSTYAGPPGEEEYVRTVGNQREIQVVMDRIFQMDVAGWADRQLTKFCVTSPLPWFRSGKGGGMHWLPLDHRTNSTMPRGNALQVEGPVEVGNYTGSQPPEGVHSAPGYPLLEASQGYPLASGPEQAPGNPYQAGFPLGGASSSDPYRGFSYSTQSHIISVGQKVDWKPELRGLAGPGAFSVTPPLPSGLFLAPDTGRVTGVVASCPAEPWEWVNYSVIATYGGHRHSTMLQIKVVDLVRMQIEHISQCRGDKYAVIFKQS